MHRKFFSVFLLFCLVLFGCASMEKELKYTDHEQIVTEKLIIDNNMSWSPYEGELNEYDIGTLREVSYSTKNGVVSLLGDHYITMEVSGEKLRTIMTCGWKLQLDKLTAIAKIKPSTVIFAQNGVEELSFLLLVDEETKNTEWLIQQNSKLNNITKLEFREFDIDHNTNKTKSEIFAEKLWDYHTNSAYTEADGVLDGEWESDCITFKYQKYNALIYCINFGICEEKLYISNAANGIIIGVPLGDIYK